MEEKSIDLDEMHEAIQAAEAYMKTSNSGVVRRASAMRASSSTAPAQAHRPRMRYDSLPHNVTAPASLENASTISFTRPLTAVSDCLHPITKFMHMSLAERYRS